MEDIICIKKDFKSRDMAMEILKEISFFDMVFSLKLIIDNLKGMLNISDEEVKKIVNGIVDVSIQMEEKKG
ncbi:hypothetical protein, partial [Anaerofustis butyriciformans]|uniref:hypothetical protein n=1 Tax=Anaerofustis butyriciformans TaxID=3108533 RepID=UPI002E381026